LATLNIQNLTNFFVLKNNKYELNSNVSYINLPSLIMAKFNISFEDIVNFCFKDYHKYNDNRVITLFYSCMQNNTFPSIDITNILLSNKFSYTLLENVFSKFEDSYMYFPLGNINKEETKYIEVFLRVASLMLYTNTYSAKNIVNSGLNKILLSRNSYDTYLQNEILDLKLTCNLYL
tara:strand:- start:2570 stop:3100 length:531 start_codon:yes stop_codon:yes gene_type:complete